MHAYTHIYAYTYMCTPAASLSQMCTLISKKHLYNVYTCTCTGAQNICYKVHATPIAKKNHIYAYKHTYAHVYICTWIHMCIHDTTQTCRRTAIETDNLFTNMHTHTYTNAYTCIRILRHLHMHLYTYIHVRTHTYIHIYTHTHTRCTYARTQACLERRRCSDCVRSPTWCHESSALLLSKW